jgi:gluconate 2-dehydrogenase gamma chain
MAGQGVERREMMRLLALASAAATFPGFRRWVFACEHVVSDSAPSRTEAYQPLFFTAEEYATVEHLSSLIIPSDGSPGAKEAGVAEFIDFMVANGADLEEPRRSRAPRNSAEAVYAKPWAYGYGIQNRFRYGLGWLDAHTRGLYGHPWRECSADQQTEVLDCLAYKKHYRPGEEDGQAFFRLARTYAVAGFYTSKIGLEALDYPGLKVMWDRMPECPHKDDPEHSRLRPPAGQS